MKCPICGKELELRNKQVGTGENGEPVFNRYAICRDCKKQWNLDKQRKKKPVQPAEAAAPEKAAAEKKAAVKKPAPVKKEPAKKPEAAKQEPAKKPEAEVKPPVKKKRPRPESEESVKKPAPKKRPRPDEAEKAPVRKKRPAERTDAEEKRYSNIPSEKVREKRGNAARKGYNDMLETGAVGRKSAKKKPEPKAEEYDDEEYFDDDPRFRPMRIILGIISLAAFGYLIYRGFVTGLADTTEGSTISSGMTYIIIALCMLVSALLYFIMMSRNTVFAFLLPMVFYLGGGIFAFLQRGDDMQLLIAAVAGAVLAVVSLILALTSRGGYNEEDDYDDAFEDDYADEDYDD